MNSQVTAGVLGPMAPERSVRDRQMLGEFGCVTEAYCGSSVGVGRSPALFEPRSVKDQMMLKEFNSCSEGYCGARTYQTFAKINDNPDNPYSGSVSYVPLK